MIATGLMLILTTAVLSTYLFLGRNVTRLSYLQQQEMKTRHTLRVFSQDVGMASQLTSASSTQFGLTTPAGAVTYTYTYNATTATGKLTRTDPTGAALDILTDISSFAINYYTESQVANGTAFSAALAVPTNALSIKAVEFSFTTRVGSSAAGTLASYTAMSPRVLLRNRTTLL